MQARIEWTLKKMKKKSKKLKFLKRCTQKVQLSKAATEDPGAPPHCTSASVFQTTSILFFLHLMKISLQLHTLFLNSWVRTFAKIENKNLTSNLTQNRVQPPKTSPIEQISYRCEPKISPLRRVTLQCRVTPYSGENLSLLLHISEPRSLPRIATKLSTTVQHALIN